MSEQKEFEFNYEPIRGYPELRWTGKRPFTGTPYYPAQLKESYGDDIDGWRNKIYWGDNLQVMSHLLKDYRGLVNLIYIDPPFDSKADYKKKIELRGKAATTDSTTFEEKQYGDIWTNDEYLQFMYERLILCRELLADNGSIYLHCDWHKSHYLRNIMSEVFGENLCRNEIIWCYKTSLRASDKAYGHDHDTILFYAKTSENIIHPDKKDFPSSESTIKRWGKYADENGFVSNKHFAGSASTIINTEDETKGFNIYYGIPRDWWEISSNVAKGNTSEVDAGKYPTQKPEALLERIIKASSNPGDIVFDCFMGSGTTQAVAMKLGRRFIGADINLGAVQTTTKRLIKVAKDLNGQLQTENHLYTGFEVYNVNDYEFFRNELEAKRLICEAMGMEQLTDSNVYDALYEGRKVCILGINRIATASEFAKLLSNVNISEWQERQKENPTKPVEQITFVCMGHDPNLKAQFEEEVSKMGFKVDVEIIDLLRDKKDLRFKRDSDAKVVIKNGKLVIENFYPMNLLQKLSIEKTDVSDWKELAESVFIDWNYDGVTFCPEATDIPEKNELVKGEYEIPKSAGTIHIKITDLISESWEGNVEVE
ncbi:site-specific DNA-methyltransferase [Treponema sp.]|uniref:site-specific DNA-methyltransferase n=1 Tax=Treponema sp. TaxID=166 RepID=UPI00257A8EB1|nr:site-specific DNA-methyltransferase [Treponema sp.]